PILKNSTFNANQAGHAGGALYNLLSGPILTNLTFNANSATGLDSMGGAIFDDASTLTLRNVTLSGNSASAGGALYHGSGSAGQVDNSILWADGASEAVIDSSVQPSTLLIYDSLAAGGCPAGALCSHVLNADPLLGPLANNGGTTQTMALGAGSAAIDSGSSAACPPTDQRGVKRPQGPQCDMGAYEMSSVTASLLSAGALDGWVLESTETSSLGGTLDSTAATFLLGDDAANRQYRAILSFDTSGIPPTAVITSAMLKIKRAGLVGTDPFTTHQYILADMRSGFFSTLEALQTKDFSAASSRPSAFSILNTPVNGWYSAPLAPTRFMYINRSGLTQIRLRFRLDDDNDLSADYLKFYSGDIGVSSARPRLVITYYVPQ
ncbi:MAG: choice-of-anchor Q domain-containing protein, partial [Bacteroidota bacterium]